MCHNKICLPKKVCSLEPAFHFGEGKEMLDSGFLELFKRNKKLPMQCNASLALEYFKMKILTISLLFNVLMQLKYELLHILLINYLKTK